MANGAFRVLRRVHPENQDSNIGRVVPETPSHEEAEPLCSTEPADATLRYGSHPKNCPRSNLMIPRWNALDRERTLQCFHDYERSLAATPFLLL